MKNMNKVRTKFHVRRIIRFSNMASAVQFANLAKSIAVSEEIQIFKDKEGFWTVWFLCKASDWNTLFDNATNLIIDPKVRIPRKRYWLYVEEDSE